MGRTAIVVGATGLVGSFVQQHLEADDSYETVHLLARRTIQTNSPKSHSHVVDFNDLDKHKALFGGDDLFCCLGTTIKIAKTKAAFYKVDFTYVYESAKLAAANGVNNFLLVSAIGANSKSLVYYSRVKGEIEDAVKKMPFQSVQIFQPSLLLGPRKTKRLGEQFGETALNLVGGLLIGSLKKYKGIQASDVALAMIARAKLDFKESFTILSDEIQVIANREKESP